MQDEKTGEAFDLIVLAGGAATRLGPAAPLPKALMPVGGVPFLGRLLAELSRTDRPRRVIACVRKGTVPAFTSFARTTDQKIEILEEKEPLGTGGAILNAREMIAGLSDPFVVVNGDVLFRMEPAPLMAAARKAGAAIATISVPDAARFGHVRVDSDRIVAFMEKGMAGPGLVSAGLYAFTRNALAAFPAVPLSFETVMAPALARRGRLAAVEMQGPFIDIGTPESLAAAQAVIDRLAA